MKMNEAFEKEKLALKEVERQIALFTLLKNKGKLPNYIKEGSEKMIECFKEALDVSIKWKDGLATPAELEKALNKLGKAIDGNQA